jgi:uncharacterized membrane protein YtjA (UPF0391 family)
MVNFLEALYVLTGLSAAAAGGSWLMSRRSGPDEVTWKRRAEGFGGFAAVCGGVAALMFWYLGPAA